LGDRGEGSDEYKDKPSRRCRAPIISFAAAFQGRESPPNGLELGERTRGMFDPRVVPQGVGRGIGESITTRPRITDKQMSPKLITTQCLFHVVGKKYACTHIPRGWRALCRCIWHSVYARTSVEARTHAHQVDRTQKSYNSNLFKHKKYGKHAPTERLRRHGQGMGHAGTKGCGRNHQM